MGAALGRLGGLAFTAWRATRHDVLARERRRLRLDEFTPRVMSAFVRNKRINEGYLPLARVASRLDVTLQRAELDVDALLDDESRRVREALAASLARASLDWDDERPGQRLDTLDDGWVS